MDRFETFEVTAQEFTEAHVGTWQSILMSDEDATAEGLAGYYYWFCQPGCLPDGEAIGPHDTQENCIKAATAELNDTERYSVVVGNIGEVESCNDRVTASRVYNEYVALSKRQTGRASGEDVTIMDNGEPIREYIGK